ncbi:MAG: PKD domain-containing protein [Chitinophagaceae bacterium]|nr:PKD domain-containing protein [Chitinophagaceae bacterium]
MQRKLLIFFYILFSLRSYAQQAIQFVENKGQWDKRVLFKGEVTNGAFFIQENGYTVLQQDPVSAFKLQEAKHHTIDSFLIRSHAWRVEFVNAAGKVIPEKELPTYNNYFLGNDPDKWATACKIYQAVAIKDIYPNIDLRYYTDQGMLKYDFIVRPGGLISDITLRYTGVEALATKKGELHYETSVGSFKESAPFTYQPNESGRQQVPCRYVVKNNTVRFEVGKYDPSQILVIDPSIIFCSFSGSTADNWGFTATYGPDGSMYAGGIVFNDGGRFPTSTGAIQSSFQGGETDICLIKLSPDGRNRLWATYLGGSGNEQPHSLVVDAQENLYLTGRTNSPNSTTGFPLIGNGSLAGDGFDIIVAKINSTGTTLLGSRKIGGTAADGVNIATSRALNSLQRNYGDDGRGEIILDPVGNVFVVSHTQSSGGASGNGAFPVTAGAFQTNFGGGLQDAVLLKFSNNLSTLQFASFFGGTGNDAGYVISVNPSNGNIYMGGGTESPNLIPSSQSGTVISSSLSGTIDGYLTIIKPDGTQRIKTTYLGTSGIDQVFGVQFDVNGFPYVMGQTTGNWPIQNAVFNNPSGKQFIAKLQPDLSAFVYSTAFGSGAAIPNISPVAFLVDRCENVYMSGWGGTGFGSGFTSAGTAGLPLTPDAFKSNTDGKDFYFFVLKKDASGQLFGSFFGEDNSVNNGNDHVDGGTSRFDRSGAIYQAICGNCSIGNSPRPNYPVTAGAWSTTNNSSGAGCSLTMVKIAMNLAGVQSAIRSSINNVVGDTLGCVPLTVAFRDTVGNAQSYEWDFGDGSPRATTAAPTNSHTYAAVGTYRVMLIAIDPSSCNGRDTSYVQIRVGNIEATLDFNPVKLLPCTSLNYRFDNLSTTLAAYPFQNTSFRWNFGDGSAPVTAGTNSVFHTYSAPGTYQVTLYLIDTTYCNAPDSLKIPLTIAENVKAGFTTSSIGCAPYDAVFSNTSVAGQTYNWIFGDGNTSTQSSPTHTYTLPGTYTVTLIANNPNTCNFRDTARFTIQVLDAPISNFSFTPVVIQPNTPHTFTNLSSSDAIRFKWNFGDGDSILTTSRVPIVHQYKSSGTFQVCLTAYNQLDCPRTICKSVEASINPLVDVPNAFTPQSGDINSVIQVKGFGIVKLKWEIWNRWGQKVFETTDAKFGWDGKFKGVLQPMDVYMYTLAVEFFDGRTLTKKGDITLIR